MKPNPSGQTHVYDYCIDEHGDWFCEGNPVTDPVLFRVLSRSLFQQGEIYFIRCEGEIHPVRVIDAPLWIRYIHVQRDALDQVKKVDVELRDGRKEPLAAESLTASGNEAVYCLATRRRLKARFAKAAYYELAQYIEMEDDQFYLVIAGNRYYIHSDNFVS
jgi:hypothetical protein